MTDEERTAGEESGPIHGGLIAAVVGKLMDRCAERMLPRMRAMCGPEAGDKEDATGVGPPCRDCG